jgi:hypothetical protein
MSEQGLSTTVQLLEGIRKGMVSRQVRLFAAQGLLPVSRDDLLRLQVVLTSDPDQELAEIATNTVKEVEAEVIVEWLGNKELEPIELDLVSRARKEEPIWSAVATHPKVSDQTLRVLARHCGPMLQDIIITNQVRIFSCLEILDELRANPQVTQVVLRRVREFEEEFIEKAALGQEPGAADKAGEAPQTTLEEALEALKAIGGQVPGEKEMPYPKDEDPALEKAIEEKGGESAFGRIIKMTVKEKILCALKGNREERAILINSRNRLVLNAVLASPKINDNEVEQYAQLRSVADEVIRIIARNNKWLRKYSIQMALIFNPKTPIQTTLRLINQLNKRDLTRVIRDRNVPQVVRRRAKEIVARLR